MTMLIKPSFLSLIIFWLDQFREQLLRLYLRLCPYQSGDNLDKLLIEYLPELASSSTIYLEAGANNGWLASNSYFLERLYNASGILIEASPAHYGELLLRRSFNNFFFLGALVDPQTRQETPFIDLHFSGLQTVLIDAKLSDLPTSPELHAIGGMKDISTRSAYYTFPSRTCTLQEIIDLSGYSHIDILILDLEGQEYSALLGLDLVKTLVKNILIESREPQRIISYLRSFGYSLRAELSPQDFLFSRR